MVDGRSAGLNEPMGNRSRDPDRAGGPPFEATVPPGDAFQRGGLVALVALALAFLGRVLAQLVQVVAPTAKLPAFDQWQSGALPYPALLASQVAIIGAQWTVIARVRRERWRPSRRQALALATFGTAYFVFMTFRLVAGSTILRGSWFDAPLPSVFHIVLASFVVTMAFAGRPRRAVPALRPALDLVADTATYPAIMIGAVGLFIAALTIVPGPVAAYGAVAVATAAVLGSELVRPYRRDWRPDRATVAADAAFLALVQILLPTAVAALAVAALQLASPALGLGVGVPWPHHWPVVGQVALMLVAADGAR
jgi:hypothetical protein